MILFLDGGYCTAATDTVCQGGIQEYAQGEETEGDIFMDSLMEIPLTKGAHRITILYGTPGLAEGIFISLFSLWLFWFLAIRKKPEKPKDPLANSALLIRN